jgi:hypothetical protein
MVKTCSQCKATNRDDATFCSSCGSSFGTPTIKPVPSVEIVSSSAQLSAAPIRVPPPGMCYYHPTLPATYICSRCGRPIGRECANFYGDLVICPQCYPNISPMVAPAAPAFPPAPYGQPPMPPPPGPPMLGGPMFGGPMPGPIPGPAIPPRPRSVWGFLLSLVAGIVTIIAGAAATAILFANLAVVPAWLANYWMAPLGIGILLGLVIILGAFLIWQGYSTLGGILVFVFALANIYLAVLIVVPVLWVYAGIAIGIIALVLGLIGGLLGVLSK